MGAMKRAIENAAHTLYPDSEARRDRFMEEVMKGHVPEGVVHLLANRPGGGPWDRPVRYRGPGGDIHGTLLLWGSEEVDGGAITAAIIECDDGRVVVGSPENVTMLDRTEKLADEPCRNCGQPEHKHQDSYCVRGGLCTFERPATEDSAWSQGRQPTCSACSGHGARRTTGMGVVKCAQCEGTGFEPGDKER